MYRCCNCLRILEQGILVENHLINDDFFVIEEVCPYCRNYIYLIEEGEKNSN